MKIRVLSYTWSSFESLWLNYEKICCYQNIIIIISIIHKTLKSKCVSLVKWNYQHVIYSRICANSHLGTVVTSWKRSVLIPSMQYHCIIWLGIAVTCWPRPAASLMPSLQPKYSLTTAKFHRYLNHWLTGCVLLSLTSLLYRVRPCSLIN